jgi:VWFA-related protein
MHKRLLLLFLGVSAGLVFGQGSKPSENTTIHATTRWVLVNVVATDKQGLPVQDLKRDDFSILEDGKTQPLASFSVEKLAVAKTSGKARSLPEHIYTNRPEYNTLTGPLTLVLLDELNTPWQDQSYARRQLLEYLGKQNSFNQPVAIMVLRDSLTLLQNFTSDPRLLTEAVTKYRPGLSNLDIVDLPDNNPVPANPVVVPSSDPQSRGMFSSNAVLAQHLGDEDAAFNKDRRVAMTLAAFRVIGRALAGYPGRKKMVWISGGIPAAFFPKEQSALDSTHSYSDDIGRTDNLLTDAQVSVYSIDAKGLATLDFPYQGSVGRDPSSGQIQNPALAQSVAAGDLYESQAAMKEIAEQTGGRDYTNQNDIARLIDSTMTDGNLYYALAYVPQNKKWNGGFRKIQVKVNRKGVDLRYRRGYFATELQLKNTDDKNQDAELMAALRGGSLPATMVWFDTRIVPATASEQPSQVNIDTLIYSQTVPCEEQTDGTHRCNVELHVAAISHDGSVVTHDDKKLESTISASTYDALRQRGIPFHSKFALQPGDYQICFAVRDNQTGSVGTLQVPLTVKPLGQ